MSTLRAPARLFLKGIPDNHLVKTHVAEPYSHQQFTLPGTAAFLTELHEKFGADPTFCCPPALPAKPAFKLPKAPLVNYMAEADRYRGALKVAEWIVQKTGLPCFNHPAAVAASTRDGVSRTLQGIPGLIVPTTVRFKPQRPQDFPVAAEKAGLKYPVLVRLTGTQTGQTLIRIEGSRDWGKIFSIPWGGSEVYLTQFHDFADADGLYRKLRLVIVGDTFFARHLYIAKDWMVHGRSFLPEKAEEERDFLERFDREWRPVFSTVVATISNRLQLDYVGLDVSPRPDGTLLLFEANASMSILRLPTGHSDLMPVIARRVSTALIELIEKPKRWRHPGQAGIAA